MVADENGMYPLIFDGGAEEGTILHLDLALICQLAIQWFNVLLITFLLMLILYNPVRKFMTDRAERIKNDIESAKKNNLEALEHKAEYERLIADIAKEREEIIFKAHREAVDEADRILFEAQEAARDLIQKAKDEIRLEHENSADEIRRQIIEVSTLMAARFIEFSMDSATHNRFIDEALEDWSEHKWQA
jgi:F-type H+-transporting ATPase subunit b